MKKFAVALVLVALLGLSLINLTSAYGGVAVKPGDWIEYAVTVTGNPSPDLNVTWGRIDVVAVNGSAITVDVQTRFANGTLFPEPGIKLNVASGAIGDGFFIPTDIQVGDVYSTQYEGNITIEGTQTITEGGAQREVLYGGVNGTTYYWDKETRIMIKATSELPNCTMYTETGATNIWQPQTPTSNVVYAFAAAAVAALLAVVLAAVFLRIQHKIGRRS